MNQIRKIINKKNSSIPLIFVLLILSNCNLIDSNNYSFYEIFVNPEVGDLSEEFESGSDKPDLDSVPGSLDIDE